MMGEIQDSQEAEQAIKTFHQEIKNKCHDQFIPKAGDLCIVNNKMVAHGRSGFKAGSFEGKPVEKRWMLRMMSVQNLSQTFAYSAPESPYMIEEGHFGAWVSEIEHLAPRIE